MRAVATQIEYCESRADGAAGGDLVRPYRRLLVHGSFIVLATEVLEGGERPVASGLLKDEAATLLASLVRAARWEGFTPGAAERSQVATLTFDDHPTERVTLRFEPVTGIDGVVERTGVEGYAATMVGALGSLLDVAFARGTKGIQGWTAPPLDGPRDTIPSPPPEGT